MLEQLIDLYRNLNWQIKIGVLVALLGLAGWSSWEAHVQGALEDLDAANAADGALDAKLAGVGRSSLSRASIEAERKKAEDDINAMMELLPKDAEVEKLLAGFADASKESGANLLSFAPSLGMPDMAASAVSTMPMDTKAGGKTGTPAKPGPGGKSADKTAPAPQAETAKRFVVDVVLTGSYAQVVSFFDRVVSMPRLVRLEKVSMKMNQAWKKASEEREQMGGASGVPPMLDVTATFTSFVQQGDALAQMGYAAPTNPFPAQAGVATQVPPQARPAVIPTAMVGEGKPSLPAETAASMKGDGDQ